MISYCISFITPLFSKGSYDERPEIRASSIRGQLHWWFRALGGTASDENAIFGSVHAKPVLASKIVVRVGNVQGHTGQANTLPHKSGGMASPKWAFQPGTSFELHFLERFRGLNDSQRAAFKRTVETWLLLGTLGLRATRAAGSFSWQPLSAGAPSMPESLDAWHTRCSNVLANAPIKFHLSDQPFSSAEAARRIVSDTLGGTAHRYDENSLRRINDPLGRARNGRKTSPLRFRIVPVLNCFHIAAVWDNRKSVTKNHESDLAAVIALLNEKGKPLGRILQSFR